MISAMKKNETSSDGIVNKGANKGFPNSNGI